MLERVEWHKLQKKIQEEQTENLEQERLARALIDWHDFVVVETITLEEEQAPAPPAVPQLQAQPKVPEPVSMVSAPWMLFVGGLHSLGHGHGHRNGSGARASRTLAPSRP